MFVKHASVISSPHKARRIDDNGHGTREDTDSGSEKPVMVPQDDPWETQGYIISERSSLHVLPLLNVPPLALLVCFFCAVDAWPLFFLSVIYVVSRRLLRCCTSHGTCNKENNNRWNHKRNTHLRLSTESKARSLLLYWNPT